MFYNVSTVEEEWALKNIWFLFILSLLLITLTDVEGMRFEEGSKRTLHSITKYAFSNLQARTKFEWIC